MSCWFASPHKGRLWLCSLILIQIPASLLTKLWNIFCKMGRHYTTCPMALEFKWVNKCKSSSSWPCLRLTVQKCILPDLPPSFAFISSFLWRLHMFPAFPAQCPVWICLVFLAKGLYISIRENAFIFLLDKISQCLKFPVREYIKCLVGFILDFWSLIVFF